MTEEQDKYVADEIKAGRCPFGQLKPGQTMAHCPLGFPGCHCADEYDLNPHFAELRSKLARDIEDAEGYE
jgi:hypothetical protein